MATDPVSAFLQGFAVVDRLETNRQTREFQRENQSRLRTIWQREDDEFKRTSLNRIKQENLVKFDATVRQVMQELSDIGNGIEDETARAEYFRRTLGSETSIDGVPTGQAMIFNEATRRMIDANPEFGEHISLALGMDAAAGPLVQDKSRPVSGVGFVPGQGAVVEVNSVNGPQPLTEQRTSSPNDKIFLGQVGLPQLVDIFGEGVMSNDLLIAQQLRAAIGEDQVTGQPFKSGGESPPSTAATPQALEDSDAASAERLKDLVVTQEDLDAGGVVDRPFEGDLGPEVTFGRETEAESEPSSSGKVRSTKQDPNSGIVAFTGQENADQLGETIAERERRKDLIAPTNFVGRTPPQGKFDAEASAKVLSEIGDQLVQAKNDFLDFVLAEGHQDTGASKPATTKPAETVADIEGDKKEYAATKVANDPAKAGAQAPNIAPEAVPAVAESVVTAASTPGRPNLYEVYNAVGLTKAGVITPAQLSNYARTGNFDQAAQRKLRFFQHEGTVTAFDEVSGQPVSTTTLPGGGGVDQDAELRRREAIRTSINKQTKSNFIFDDDYDERAHGQFVDNLEEIYAFAGVPQGNIGRTDDTFLNSAARGAEFVHRFDMDDIRGPLDGQNRFDTALDSPAADFQLPNTAGNMALGAVISEAGVTSQQEATFALHEYANTLAKGAGISGAALVHQAKGIEVLANQQLREVRRSGILTLPDGSKVALPDRLQTLAVVRQHLVRYQLDQDR